MPASGLKSKRNPWLWIPSLYLVEGLPNAIVVTVAVVLLKNMGLDNGRVALYTSLLYLPWVIKPFWSPFVDIIGSKRRWIRVMQILLATGMAAIAITLGTKWWLIAALASLWGVAFCSATHDIAADGFYLLALDDKTQAFFVGIRSTFYRLANLLASGGIVWLAGYFMTKGIDVAPAWQIIFAAVSVFFLIAALWHHITLPTPASDNNRNVRTVREIFSDFAQVFHTFFAKPNILTALAFLLLYRLPEAFLCKMVQPFLLDSVAEGGLGLTTQEVGLANGTFGVIGIVTGGIIGGLTMSRFGLKKCIWPMALALTLPSAFYWYMAILPMSNMTIICSGIAIEQFGYGFGFTAYMMYMMLFCENSEFSTSHYAFSTGIMALGLMLPGFGAGALQLSVGYPIFFALVMILCIPTFVVTALVSRSLKK